MSSALQVIAASHGFRFAPAAVASVTIFGAASVAEGSTTPLSAVVQDAAGNVLEGRTVTWASDSSHATVNSSGGVGGVSAGVANITATCEGVASDPYEVTVTAEADATAPAAPTGLAAGTPANLTIPLAWDSHPDTDGDLAGFWAFYTSDETDPTAESEYQIVSSDPAATGADFVASLATTLYKLALAAVDSSGNVSDLSSVVSATTGDAPATYEPAGMTTIFWSKGTKPTTGGNSKFQDPTWVEQVTDADAPYGTAVEWRWINDGAGGDNAGARGTYNLSVNPNLDAVASEIYYRLVIKYPPTWVHNPSGDKLMFFGGAAKNSAYYPTLRCKPDRGGVIDTGYRFGWSNQDLDDGPPTLVYAPSDGTTPYALGSYYTLEYYMKEQSAAGVADGILRLRINGEQKINRTDMTFVQSGATGFQGFQWFPYFGGSGSKGDYGLAGGATDWLRYGELYVSGKV